MEVTLAPLSRFFKDSVLDLSSQFNNCSNEGMLWKIISHWARESNCAFC